MSDATISSSVGQGKDTPKPAAMVGESEIEDSSVELSKLSQSRPS